MLTACGTNDRENITDKELESTTNIEVKETQEESHDEFVESTENQTEIVADDSIIDNTERLTDKEIETTANVANIDTSVVETVKPIETQPATEPTTTSKPVQVPTEPTNTKPTITEPPTTKPSHTHSWQPVYKTVIITEAWDEPIYEETPVYETHKVHHHSCYICVASPFYIIDGNNNKGVDLTEAYKYWLEIDGVGCYGDGSWRDFKTEVGTYGYACDTAYATAPVLTGYAPQIVGYTHHDAVTEMYIDYYYCGIGRWCILEF